MREYFGMENKTNKQCSDFVRALVARFLRQCLSHLREISAIQLNVYRLTLRVYTLDYIIIEFRGIVFARNVLPCIVLDGMERNMDNTLIAISQSAVHLHNSVIRRHVR